jgi:glycosyltransferase involved in cell wall biosynthesis
LFLDAIALLPDTCNHLKFIIAGEFYTDAAPYQAQIDTLGIRDRLILHDHYISNVEVKYYFCAADLVVQPYKSATQSGIAQIAIHFNKPTVVTRVGGLHEIIDHNESGFVVDVSGKSIAEAITDFFSRADHSSFYKALELTKSNFSWNRMAMAMLSGK